MVNPNYFVIGAQRCGTTWLAKSLGQHPDVYVPEPKEIHYFNRDENLSKSIIWYRRQFAGYHGEKAVGEFTPNYFWVVANTDEIGFEAHNRNIPALIHQHYPNAKLILTLRDPVRRAISAYFHHIWMRRISPRTRLLDAAHSFGILSMGMYFNHLIKWLEFYKLEQILILNFEDEITRNGQRTVQKVFRFLDVDDTFRAGDIQKKYNKKRGDTFLFAHYYFPAITRVVSALYPPVREAEFFRSRILDSEINELIDLYRESNHKLESFLNRHFPWMS